MSDNPKRSWLERLGLKAGDAGPEDWVIVTRARLDAGSGSSDAEDLVAMLAQAGIEAEVKRYVAPDHRGLPGMTGNDGSSAQSRVRIAVVVRQRDQSAAEEIAERQADPITDEELSRLAEEAGPPPES